MMRLRKARRKGCRRSSDRNCCASALASTFVFFAVHGRVRGIFAASPLGALPNFESGIAERLVVRVARVFLVDFIDAPFAQSLRFNVANPLPSPPMHRGFAGGRCPMAGGPALERAKTPFPARAARGSGPPRSAPFFISGEQERSRRRPASARPLETETVARESEICRSPDGDWELRGTLRVRPDERGEIVRSRPIPSRP